MNFTKTLESRYYTEVITEIRTRTFWVPIFGNETDLSGLFNTSTTFSITNSSTLDVGSSLPLPSTTSFWYPITEVEGNKNLPYVCDDGVLQIGIVPTTTTTEIPINTTPPEDFNNETNDDIQIDFDDFITEIDSSTLSEHGYYIETRSLMEMVSSTFTSTQTSFTNISSYEPSKIPKNTTKPINSLEIKNSKSYIKKPSSSTTILNQKPIPKFTKSKFNGPVRNNWSQSYMAGSPRALGATTTTTISTLLLAIFVLIVMFQ